MVGNHSFILTALGYAGVKRVAEPLDVLRLPHILRVEDPARAGDVCRVVIGCLPHVEYQRVVGDAVAPVVSRPLVAEITVLVVVQRGEEVRCLHEVSVDVGCS